MKTEQSDKMQIDEALEKARGIIHKIILPNDDRISLVNQIAIDVGAEIVEEIIPPGHDLNSVELARRYKTSRTPIREALMLLEKEGLVDIPPRRRARVKVHNLHTTREVYRTRATLLAFISSEVALLATPEDIAVLRAQVEKMKVAHDRGDTRAYVWAIIKFHDLNCTVSRNMTAKRIIESLLLRTITLRRWSLSQTNRMMESLDDHHLLIRAYENKDPHLASAIVHSNHIAALKRVESMFKDGKFCPPISEES